MSVLLEVFHLIQIYNIQKMQKRYTCNIFQNNLNHKQYIILQKPNSHFRHLHGKMMHCHS